MNAQTKTSAPETPAPSDVLPVSFNSGGLKKALFEEIDLLRRNQVDPLRSHAVARLATALIKTVEVEMAYEAFANRFPDRQKDKDDMTVPKGISFAV